MTEEEALRYAVRKTLEQGKPSVDGEGNCSYRGQGGVCCAVGFLIKDEAYDEGLEGRDSLSDEVQEALMRSGLKLTNHTLRYLNILQNCHDESIDSDFNFKKYFSVHIEYQISIGNLPKYLLEELQ